MEHAREKHELSERHACRLVNQWRGTQRYLPIQRVDEDALTRAIITLASEYGFVMPPVRILDNMRLPNHGYAIRIKEMEAGTGEVRLNHLMAMDPRGGQVDTLHVAGQEAEARGGG